jgi:hypothetical protein
MLRQLLTKRKNLEDKLDYNPSSSPADRRTGGSADRFAMIGD